MGPPPPLPSHTVPQDGSGLVTHPNTPPAPPESHVVEKSPDGLAKLVQSWGSQVRSENVRFSVKRR